MILPFDHFNPNSLRAFEARVANVFNAGKIKAPVHLSGGNELELLEYFRTVVSVDDYVCTAWRSHYHCLLKGVPEEVLFADIVAGKSITLNYPDHRIVSSAIVGGIVPIAVGIAMAVKRQGSGERVHCFMGDMTGRSGIKYECAEYSKGHDLPITFIVENNGLSVCTPTKEAWGTDNKTPTIWSGMTKNYRYELTWPHSGAGKRVEF